MMKILKEDMNTANLAKAVCNLIAGKSAQNLKDLLLGKANGSSKAMKILTDIAKAIINKDPNYPTKRLEFLTRNMPKFNTSSSPDYIDFTALANDKEVNPLNILGLLSIPIYSEVLKSDSYRKFISMFSADGNFDNLSYVLLGEFTEAFNVDNIDINNEFIKTYLNSNQKLFTVKTTNRKQFEKVYNSYVNDSVFDINRIKNILKKTN